MRAIIKAIVHFLVIIVYRPKVIGKENIPEEGACIICPNHVHALDSAVILTTLKRHINFMAKEELFKNGFIRYLAKVFGIFPVKRGGKDMEEIKSSLKILKRGEILAMFPEGTRNGLEKGVKPKNGAVLIAIKAGVPIIPCGVNGSFKPFTKVTLKYGKPIYFDKDIDVQDKEKVNELTKQVMDEVIKLRENAQKCKSKVDKQ